MLSGRLAVGAKGPMGERVLDILDLPHCALSLLITHCSGIRVVREIKKMANRLLRKEVLQSYKRCCQVANTVFKNDPDNIKFGKA